MDVLREQAALRTDHTIESKFANYYNVIHEYVNKILSNCEKQNRVAASFAASLIQDEISLMLAQAIGKVEYSDFNIHGEYATYYHQQQFPELMQFTTDGDLATLARQARRLGEKARAWMQEQSLSLNILETPEDLERFLEERDPVPSDKAVE